MRRKAVLTAAAAALFALSASAGAASKPAVNDGLANNLPPEKAKAMQTEFLSAMAALKNHVNGTTALTDKQIEAHALTIDSTKEIFGYNDAIIKACFDLVSTYDDRIGPLWVARGDFNRKDAKFVDIARLFGWKPLNDFWYSTNVDFENGKPWSKHGTDIDQISLRLSQKAGCDLTGLLHFWGTPPRDAKALKAAVAASKLPASAKIYDTLVHYKSLVPKDNKAFRDFATKWWGKQPSSKGFTTERNHAQQWEKYDEKTAAAITSTVQEIIDLYFPNGRPVNQ